MAKKKKHDDGWVSGMTDMLEKDRIARQEANSAWNNEFPPNKEIQVVDGLGTQSTVGIWYFKDAKKCGFATKYANGYNPDSIVLIDREIVKAMFRTILID